MTYVARRTAAAVHPTRLVQDYAELVATIAKTVDFNANAEQNVVTCTVALPDGTHLSCQAGRFELAAKKLLASLGDTVLAAHDGSHWMPAYEAVLAARLIEVAEDAMESGVNDGTRSKTKERQETIGVNTKKSFHNAVSSLADSRGESIAEVARELLSVGFEEFETRSFLESESALLKNFESKLDSYAEGDASQWMIRMDRRLATRIKLSAKEYGRSASQMAAMCMSQALSELSSGPIKSTETKRLESARAAISDIRGLAARKLAEEIGLGARGPLISSILSGRVVAPRSLLRALSSKLKVPMTMLSELAKESFLAAPIPSFKAEDGKPQVQLEQQSWEEAVKSLRLSDSDTAALLRYSD